MGVCIFVSILCGLISMAYYTLLERKLLAAVQRRKGPNKVGFLGLAQPLMDALKLGLKEGSMPLRSNFYLFFMSPVLGLGVVLGMWGLVPHSSSLNYYDSGVILFYACSSVNVFSVLGCGWSSNSKYPMFGAVRGVAQSISYEVSMALVMFFPVYCLKSMDFFCSKFFGLILFVGGFFWVFLMLMVSFLAESNRSPFDFVEGESELVSGFNTEYSGGGFALIFMAEYSSILILSGIVCNLFYCWGKWGWWVDMLAVVGLVSVSLVFILARASLPRMRYDHLMSLTWKVFLPLSLAMVFLEFCLIFCG